MKVIQKTPNNLTARFRPWFKWMLASCLIGLGLPVLLQVHWARFDCTRNLAIPTQGTCTLTDHNWITSSQHSWQLEQITGAKLEPSGRTRNGEPAEYRVLLNTTQGLTELPLVDISHINYSKGTVESIQQFLANPLQPHLREQIDERFEGLYYFSLFGGAGGLFIIMGQTVILRINKKTQKLIVQRRYLLRKQTIEYPLNQISDVIVQEKRNLKGIIIGRMVIVLKDGKQVIVHPYDSGCIALCSHLCVQNIHTFLQLR